MKNLFVLLFSFLLVNAYAQSDFSVQRNPSVSATFASNLVAISSSRTVVLQEGATVDGAQENYFAVYIPGHPEGGTIFRVEPVLTFGQVLGWGTVTVHDIFGPNGQYVPVGYVGGIFLQTDGGFDMNGQHFSISLRFAGENWFPSMCITWGTDSSAHNPGNISDDLSLVVIKDKELQNHLTIEKIVGDTDLPDGMYVFVEYTNEDYVLQSSTNLVDWVNESEAFYFFGYIGCHYFPLPTTDNEKKFFRTRHYP